MFLPAKDGDFSLTDDLLAGLQVKYPAVNVRDEMLKAIRVPTLVIHGSDDPLVPIACGRDTARLIPGATLREINGMGHDLAPDLNSVMLDLIHRHCRGQSAPEMRSA